MRNRTEGLEKKDGYRFLEGISAKTHAFPVVFPNSWRVCIIKLVHVGLRSAFSRLASLIKWFLRNLADGRRKSSFVPFVIVEKDA